MQVLADSSLRSLLFKHRNKQPACCHVPCSRVVCLSALLTESRQQQKNETRCYRGGSGAIYKQQQQNPRLFLHTEERLHTCAVKLNNWRWSWVIDINPIVLRFPSWWARMSLQRWTYSAAHWNDSLHCVRIPVVSFPSICIWFSVWQEAFPCSRGRRNKPNSFTSVPSECFPTVIFCNYWSIIVAVTPHAVVMACNGRGAMRQRGV